MTDDGGSFPELPRDCISGRYRTALMVVGVDVCMFARIAFYHGKGGLIFHTSFMAFIS